MKYNEIFLRLSKKFFLTQFYIHNYFNFSYIVLLYAYFVEEIPVYFFCLPIFFFFFLSSFMNNEKRNFHKFNYRYEAIAD